MVLLRIASRSAVAARYVRRPLRLDAVRLFSNENLASDAYTKPGDDRMARLARTAQFLASLEAEDQREVAAMLRVDHSGEVAANTIYEAQADVFGYQGKPKDKALIMVCCHAHGRKCGRMSASICRRRVRCSTSTVHALLRLFRYGPSPGACWAVRRPCWVKRALWRAPRRSRRLSASTTTSMSHH